MHAGRGASVLVVRTDKYHMKASSVVVGTLAVFGTIADVCGPDVVLWPVVDVDGSSV